MLNKFLLNIGDDRKTGEPRQNETQIKRRQILQAGLGAATIVVTAACSPNQSAQTSEKGADADSLYDVIVIGGGFAGVTAARDAGRSGLKTLLVEARHRLGGRTGLQEFAGHNVEIGGTWVGHGQPHIWSEVTRYGAPVDESAGLLATDYIWYTADGERKTGGPDDYWGMMMPAYDAFYGPARTALPRPFEPLYVPDMQGLDKMNTSEAIEALDGLNATQKMLLHSLAAICAHSPSHTSSYLDQLRWMALSGHDVSFMWDNLSRYRLKSGTSGLIERMFADSGATLKLNTPISSVTQDTAGASVHTENGEVFKARTIIMAVPLNVLSNIKFKPAISTIKMKASRTRHTGAGSKVYARIEGKRPAWFGNGLQDMPFNFAWTEYNESDHQIILGFGADMNSVDLGDPDQVQNYFRQYLPDIEISDSLYWDWTRDPYALGTWCMFPPGMLTSSLKELQRPEGRIYFASGDIANGWRGFIDGAIESGASAARQVAEFIGGEVER